MDTKGLSKCSNYPNSIREILAKSQNSIREILAKSSKKYFQLIIFCQIFQVSMKKSKHLEISGFMYHTRAIISRSRFEATLVYKPQILSLKNEEFPFLVHKLSVI